jgi:signal transduction histidine kinase
MDWLDEVWDKLKVKVNNLSFKKAMAVYILFCILIVVVITAVTQAACSEWDTYIWSRYSQENAVQGTFTVVHYDYTKLTSLDRVLVEVIDFLQTWSTIIYSAIGIIAISRLFYNNKMREPLGLLKEATEKVGQNDLDIELYYDNKDEMGDLCRSFDFMRKQLMANNRKMWDMMEEQKRLNAAFAHDLRTPLTVLRGYSDLLSRYIPEGKISEDKLLATLKLMSEHISRLENYSNTMKEINSLEELPFKPAEMEVMVLENRLREIIEALDGKNGIHIKLFNSIFEGRTKLSLDGTIILEVFENLMSNALRYANTEIEVLLSLSEDGRKLLLSVSDDGKGFSKTDLVMAAKAYYTGDKGQETQHFGIGLYICRLLCEKHQGEIVLGNRINQGAVITAVFSAGEK